MNEEIILTPSPCFEIQVHALIHLEQKMAKRSFYISSIHLELSLKNSVKNSVN